VMAISVSQSSFGARHAACNNRSNRGRIVDAFAIAVRRRSSARAPSNATTPPLMLLGNFKRPNGPARRKIRTQTGADTPYPAKQPTQARLDV